MSVAGGVPSVLAAKEGRRGKLRGRETVQQEEEDTGRSCSCTRTFFAGGGTLALAFLIAAKAGHSAVRIRSPKHPPFDCSICLSCGATMRRRPRVTGRGGTVTKVRPSQRRNESERYMERR